MVTPGDKIKVRSGGFTVSVGGDIMQEGEMIVVTAKNVDELNQQEWKYEMVNNKDITNRAILDAKKGGVETKTGRVRLSKEEKEKAKADKDKEKDDPDAKDKEKEEKGTNITVEND